MAFTYGNNDYSNVFGGGDPLGMTPAMGRLLATNPEAVIPHLIAAGIEPPNPAPMPFTPPQEPAEAEGQLHSAPPTPYPAPSPDAAPPTGPAETYPPGEPMLGAADALTPNYSAPGMPAQNIYGLPPGERQGGRAPAPGPSIAERLSGIFAPPEPIFDPVGVTPGGKPNYGQTQAQIDAIRNSVAPYSFGLLSPTASGAGTPPARGMNASGWDEAGFMLSPTAPTTAPTPAPTVSPAQVAGVAGVGGGVPTPRSDPRKGTTEAAAKAAPAKGLLDALAGIKAPPAPPQPQLRPETARGGSSGGGSMNSPLVALLANLLSGGGGGGGGVRLSQALAKIGE